jgi:membrane-associated phospholipid phosphatase
MLLNLFVGQPYLNPSPFLNLPIAALLIQALFYAVLVNLVLQVQRFQPAHFSLAFLLLVLCLLNQYNTVYGLLVLLPVAFAIKDLPKNKFILLVLLLFLICSLPVFKLQHLPLLLQYTRFWLLLIVLAILTGFYFHTKRGLVFGIGLGLQSIFVALSKTWFNAPRPIEAKFFTIRHIENLEIHHWQSFPSGHTAVAFYCLGLLATSIPKLQKSAVWSVSCAFIAAGIGYSRIYLGQHFLFDVCTGGTIALLFLQLSFQISKRLGYDV